MDEALRPEVVSGRQPVGRERGDDLRREPQGVDELARRLAGMDIDARGSS